jgi:hypothetical protein
LISEPMSLRISVKSTLMSPAASSDIVYRHR